MRTVLTTDPEEAAQFIKRGGVAAFPTETVYGLGANVFDTAAVARIFKAKRRPADNPLIAHVATREQIGELTDEVTQSALKFIERYFPGPLTVVLEKSAAVPLIATAGLDTVGIRMPGFPLANRFLTACGVPVAAPSANLSGRPSPTTWEAVFEDLDGRIDCILQGEATEIGIESTVADCSGPIPIILRSGSVTIDQLRSVEPETREIGAAGDSTPRSPGLKHTHYSPRAAVVILGRGQTSANTPLAASVADPLAFIGLKAPDGAFEMQKVCASIDEYAHSLFEFFRECDRRSIKRIVCEAVEEADVGVALMDRLRRAAE